MENGYIMVCLYTWNNIWQFKRKNKFSLKTKKEILSRDMTWMNREDLIFLILRKISQSREDNIASHLDEVPRVVKFIRTESRMVAARHWGQGGLGNGARISVLQDGKSSGDCAQQC